MIDIHAHLAYYKLFPDYFIDGIAGSMLMQLPEGQRDISKNVLDRIIKGTLSDYTGERLVKESKEAGIDKTILLMIDFFYNEEKKSENIGVKFPVTIEEVHRIYYEAIQKNSDRFIAFSGIDPRRGKKGLDLLEKDINQYGFQGLKLYPPCGFELDDPELIPFYDYCNMYELPISIHTGPSIASMKKPENYPDSILKVSKQFKKVKFILAHAGILYNDIGVSIARQRNNIYLDISGFQKEIVDTVVVQKKLKNAFSFVPERILFGTDWPLFNMNVTQKQWVDKLLSIKGFSSKEMDRLLNENAKELLKI